MGAALTGWMRDGRQVDEGTGGGVEGSERGKKQQQVGKDDGQVGLRRVRAFKVRRGSLGKGMD